MNSSATPYSEASIPPPPLHLVFWETTAACNLACLHCRRLETSREAQRHDLSTDQALAMIRSLPQLGRPILVFSGGEPLMRPDLFELAREAHHRLRLPIALATNGTIMNDDLARRIAEAGFRRVAISLDGPDAAMHDRFRGIDGAFQVSLAGFRLLQRQGLAMQINATITRHNLAHLEALYCLALNLGAQALHLFLFVPVGCGMQLAENLQLRPEESEAVLNWIYDRAAENRLHIKATCAPQYFRILHQRRRDTSSPASARPTVSTVSSSTHPPRSHEPDMTSLTKGCLAGQSICFISHRGEVFPCGYLPVPVGNVTRCPLPVLWRDSPVFHQLRDESLLKGKCGRCEFRNLCMGCRARAYAATGDFLDQEPQCSYLPRALQEDGRALPA